MALTVIFSGAKELSDRLKNITDGLSDATARAAYLGAAQALAKRAQANAPVKTGRLKRAIISRGFKDAAVLRYGPGAYVQVNLQVPRRMVGRNTAPHGYIMEFGRARRVKSPRSGKPSSGMVGRFYFQRAAEAIGDSELEKAAAKLDTLLKRRYLLY